jgi:shikimate kinase
VTDAQTGPGTPLVVLIGPPGAGKTRIGKRIARIIGVAFIDTDRRIVASHGPIAQIFAEQGEAAFRRYERSIVKQALQETAVVSLGGGAVLDPETQAQLAEHRVVLVTVSSEAVEARISGSKRPLLDGIDSWSRLVESRREVYERLASGTWDTSHRPIDLIANEIAEWVDEARTMKAGTMEEQP